jgi:hypothetical protein
MSSTTAITTTTVAAAAAATAAAAAQLHQHSRPAAPMNNYYNAMPDGSKPSALYDKNSPHYIIMKNLASKARALP